MSGVRKINQKDVVDTCVKIIRKDGLDGINARRVAKEIGCSTQPIYYIYKNIDEMKKDALNKITEDFYKAILARNYDRAVYKDIGTNFIKFAKKDPELFKILFNSGRNEVAENFVNLTGPAECILELITNQLSISDEDARIMHKKMNITLTGMANLVANNMIEYDQEKIDQDLAEIFVAELLFEQKRGNVSQELVDQIMNIKLNQFDPNKK